MAGNRSNASADGPCHPGVKRSGDVAGADAISSRGGGCGKQGTYLVGDLRRQVKVLDAWAAAVASRASLRLRLIRFASHRLRRLLTRAFFQWARLSQQLTGARQRAESLSAAVLEALVASCLRAWAEKRSVSRSAEALFERVCLRVLVRDPFFAWQAVAAHGRLREAMAGISGAAQLRKEVALAWRAWKGSMEAELCRAEALKTSLSARVSKPLRRLHSIHSPALLLFLVVVPGAAQYVTWCVLFA